MDHPKLEEWKTVWRERRSVTMVYILLRISVVLVMLAQIFNGNFENVFLCVLTLILFMMPSVLEKKLDITLPNTLEIIILLFIYAAEIMGEIGAYYVTFPYWDTVLHTLNGFLCAAIGFSLLDILNRHSEARFHLSPLYLAIVAFCFSMTVGVIWEFFECTMDQLFFLDMQKDTVVNTIGSIMLDPTGGNTSTVLKNITDVIVVQADGTQTALGLGGYLDIGLLDTMEDLFVNFIGAVTFTGSVIAYGKLAGKIDGKPKKLPGGHMLNAGAAALSILALVLYCTAGAPVLWLLVITLAAFFIGYHLIMGIGGADMPVVVSMLNSYSGWAAAGIGFSLNNSMLIIAGSLVGSSGAILSYIMCKAMNRSFFNVILGGFGGATDVGGPAGAQEARPVKSGSKATSGFSRKPTMDSGLPQRRSAHRSHRPGASTAAPRFDSPTPPPC